MKSRLKSVILGRYSWSFRFIWISYPLDTEWGTNFSEFSVKKLVHLWTKFKCRKFLIKKVLLETQMKKQIVNERCQCHVFLLATLYVFQMRCFNPFQDKVTWKRWKTFGFLTILSGCRNGTFSWNELNLIFWCCVNFCLSMFFLSGVRGFHF